jgi:hypothetical protein
VAYTFGQLTDVRLQRGHADLQVGLLSHAGQRNWLLPMLLRGESRGSPPRWSLRNACSSTPIGSRRHDGTAGTEHLDDHGLSKAVITAFGACSHVTTCPTLPLITGRSYMNDSSQYPVYPPAIRRHR